MNDEGCPNEPLLNLPNKTGIEGVCETVNSESQTTCDSSG